MIITIIISIISFFFTSVIWEHVAKKLGSEFKPSVGLWNLIEPAKIFFIHIGNQIARLSSFYTYLKEFFGELFDSFVELINPLVRLCVTPFYILQGYFETALTYKYYFLVFFGTLTLVLIIISLVCYFLWKYRYNKIYTNKTMECHDVNDSECTSKTSRTKRNTKD